MGYTYDEEEREDDAFPVHFGLLYVIEGCAASLQFLCHGNSSLGVTVIHEPLTETVRSYDFPGDTNSSAIRVNDGDTLTVLVRQGGRVEGCAVLQVDMKLPARTRNIVRQCVIANVEIDPCDATLLRRGIDQALINVCGAECEVGQ